jgi:hypothetical protein
LIGDQPLEETKALNFKPNCWLTQVTVKLLAKERKDIDNMNEYARLAS